jgi:hypothetical protein
MTKRKRGREKKDRQHTFKLSKRQRENRQRDRRTKRQRDKETDRQIDKEIN